MPPPPAPAVLSADQTGAHEAAARATANSPRKRHHSGCNAALVPQVATGWKRTLPTEVYRCATWFRNERSLKEIYQDVPVAGTVWLTFANWAFRHLALNWVAHVYRLRVERALAVAALDMPFQQLLRSEGVPYFGFDHGTTGDLRSNVSGFRRLGALKGTLVLKVLRAERHVLLSDVDVVWLVDPTPILRSLALHADVMSATDCLHVTDDELKFPKRRQGTNRCAYNPGNTDGHAAFNTGVVYFRPSTAAKAFAAAWRARLLSVQNDAWLDDQLAFNELVWHGYRNHPGGAIREASADGKVIEIRMGQTGSPALPLPHTRPLPAWIEGWRDLQRNPQEAFFSVINSSTISADAEGEEYASVVDARTEVSRLGQFGVLSHSMPVVFNLAPLPARHFCSGHLFWEQQGMTARACASVHTTFVEGGNAGKLWRLKEAGLWLMEPQEYFEPAEGAR
jgi:hypothetical protein